MARFGIDAMAQAEAWFAEHPEAIEYLKLPDNEAFAIFREWDLEDLQAIRARFLAPES